MHYSSARYVFLLLTAALMSVCEAASPPAASPPPAATHETAGTAQLGKVTVHGGLRKVVHTLQQIKVALNRPLNFDPKHVDEMVCLIHTGHRSSIHHRTSAVLECGTQGWFAMRLQAGQNAAEEGYFGPDPWAHAAVSTLGHPWHIERVLNFRQLATLRKLLTKLPAPGKGRVLIEGGPGKQRHHKW
ncbi:MAG: hypothetical protein ACYDB9_01500 [Gammaproteobacteria bacterium]